MKNIRKIMPFVALLFALPVKAFCPVCTVAVGAGLGLARWLRIDDTISGLWIGGLTISMIMWTLSWLAKKNINFKGKKIIALERNKQNRYQLTKQIKW